MANHKTGAQRYNDRMDKIFAESKKLNEKYHGKDSFGTSHEKALAKKAPGPKDVGSKAHHERFHFHKKYPNHCSHCK